MVQWLRLGTSTAGAVGLMPDWGNKIPHATWPKKKKREKKIDEGGGKRREVIS